MIYALQLDERTKKVLLVLCALFIVALLIFGGIYVLISAFMKKESKKMDNYMYDLLKIKMVKNPRQFKKALLYYEERSLFNNSKWSWRCIIILTAMALLLTFAFFNSDFKRFFSEAFKLLPIIKWPTIGEVNEALGDTVLNGPKWMPASVFPTFISKNPDFTQSILYFSMIYYLSILICFFGLLKAVLGFMARIHRGFKMSTEVFNKDLDKLDVNSINNFSNTINSPIPNQDEYNTNNNDTVRN